MLGYKGITPIKLINVYAVYRFKPKKSVRKTYFSLFEMLAIRETASRIRKKEGKKPLIPHFEISEIERLTGLKPRSIKSALKSLEKEGLVLFKKNKILICDTPLKGTREALNLLYNGKRKGIHRIPVLRTFICLLANTDSDSLALNVISLNLRCVSYRNNELNNRGTLKSSLVAKVFYRSLRSIERGRAEAISLGIIKKDVSSHQLKLNKTGAYFEVNTEWGRVAKCSAESVPPAKKCSAESVPPAKKCSAESVPIYNTKNYYIYKNQKTKTGVKKQIREKEPNIFNVQLEDLKKLERNEKLYWQAVQKKLIKHSESNVINWLSAGIRASKFENIIPIFLGIIKKKLWQNITLQEEDRAVKALKKIRKANPEAFRLVA